MNSETTLVNPAPTASRPRPLSPHLQVYSWLITSTLSILHRATGVLLSFGLLLIAAWLLIAAYSPENYDDFASFMASPWGLVPLFGWTVAYNYHMLNGIRHLFWDAGYGFEIHNAARSGIAVLIGTVIITAIIWVIALEII